MVLEGNLKPPLLRS